MGIILIPLVLVTSYLLSKIGDYWVRQFLIAEFDWRGAAALSILMTVPIAFLAFALMPLFIELDPLDGKMAGWEIVQFAAVWSAYSSVFWAVMIVLGARARSKGLGR